MKTNIVIIHRTGGDFKLTDVYLLVSHINKYWGTTTSKPAIYCYTDSVVSEISVVGLTLRPLPNKEWAGWWSKMNLFSPELKELRPFLYMDIDTAVLKSIADLIPPEGKQNLFVALRDFYRPAKLASGLMWIPDNCFMDKIYAEWIKLPSIIMKRFRGDQDFISSVANANLYWQDISKPEFITTFKPNRVWRTEFPAASAIVCFHGIPRIPEAANTVKWVKSYTSYEI